jgi:hypothetical protein
MSLSPTTGSPYDGIPPTEWASVTRRLISEHPLDVNEIVDVVRIAWDGIFSTRIAGFLIGVDIEPQPQNMGFLLHELIPLEFRRRYPGQWRAQRTKGEKDLVCELDVAKSVEIKTSSHGSQVFGNRSYAQPAGAGEVGRKGKSGYYLTINFQKFGGSSIPILRIVRFGWLDHVDWIPQKAATGQQSRLRAEAYQYKLVELFKA